MLGKGWTLFKMFGFTVRIDPSWLFIAFLLLWSLAAVFFPMEYPTLTASQYFIMGIAATIGLFVSIVIHEFCHAIVARQFNLPMRGITLFIFGGIAEMDEEPQSPKAEFFMAIAGPLASIVLALAFWGLYRMGLEADWPLVTTGILAYLWRINAVLVIFNLIPAFPLDGGRIVRSVLWRWKGRLGWATRVSSQVGAGFGFVLILLGTLSIFTGNLFGGIWYIGIGLFLRWAAKASYANVLIRESLGRFKVADIMNREPKTVWAHETIEDLVEKYVYPYHHKLFPVIDHGGDLMGLIGTRNIRAIPRDEWPIKRVSDVLEGPSDKNTMDESVDALKALDRLSKSSQEIFAIKGEGSKLVGVLSLKDIMSFLSIEMELSPDTEGMRDALGSLKSKEERRRKGAA